MSHKARVEILISDMHLDIMDQIFDKNDMFLKKCFEIIKLSKTLGCLILGVFYIKLQRITERLACFEHGVGDALWLDERGSDILPAHAL